MVIFLKKWPFVIHLSLLLLFCLLLSLNAFETADLRTQDYLYQKQRPVSADIVIIAIDDESLAALGQWPWPRDYHGELIRLLAEGQPAAIGFDVIFAEPSSYPEEDAYLAAMARDAGNVILPVYGAFDESARRGLLEAQAVIEPYPELASAAKRLGHINTLISNDGIVRQTIIQFQHQQKPYNSFAYEIYNTYAQRMDKQMLSVEDVPVESWHQAYIQFSGGPFEYEVLPYYQVFNGNIHGEYFRNKIVLIGPMAAGIADDYYFTPLAPQVPMYGVEIHANILQQFMNQHFYQMVALPGQFLIMLVMAVIAFCLFTWLKPGTGLVALVVVAAGFLFITRVLGESGYIFSYLYPLTLLGLQYVAMLAQKYILEQLEKKRVTDVFGKYVAPQIVGKILKEGEQGLKLGGTRRNLTVLFVDIRGFTPLSEVAEPEVVVSILNDYLSLCAKAIFDYGGTLDKYIGDAAMAIYNTPLDLEHHQLRAVQTAWAMHEGAQPLQQQLEDRFGKTVRFGVGIHTGNAIVGNVGADFRMDYTAIGDTVNTAARIESISKPGQILISQEVYEHVKDYVEVTDLGMKQFHGKTREVQMYQVNNVLDMEKPQVMA